LEQQRAAGSSAASVLSAGGSPPDTAKRTHCGVAAGPALDVLPLAAHAAWPSRPRAQARMVRYLL